MSTSAIVVSKILCAIAATTVASLVHNALSSSVISSSHSPAVSSELLRGDGIGSVYVSDAVPQDQMATKGYTDAAQKDMITNLPGLNYDPGFHQFSGYLNVDPATNRSIFFWYIESESDPSTDPVVFWTNGGPGCSGLLGFGTEMGPYYFEKDGTLSPNPYSWNKVANILYVEQPAGVGFSYSDNPKTDYITGDKKSALDNFKLIQEFFIRFPERKSNDFYIASESYGGHYIPHLAKTILDKNTNADINFRGFLVGNPYVDPFTNALTQYEAYYQHGLIAKPLYDIWKEKCTDRDNSDESSCDSVLNAMFKEMGKGINLYALDYPSCTEEDNPDYPPLYQELSSSPSSPRHLSSQSSQLIKNDDLSVSPPFLPPQDNYKPCAEAHLYHYLNRADVRNALHTNPKLIGKKWSMCSDEIDYSSDDSSRPQMDLYKELISRGKKKGSNLKMMVYSGDDDSICSTAGTQDWIYDVGADLKKGKLWKAWTAIDDQTAGFVTHFDMNDKTSGSSFTFATVHGAGHEVPAYRPVEALELFKSFLSDKWSSP